MQAQNPLSQFLHDEQIALILNGNDPMALSTRKFENHNCLLGQRYLNRKAGMFMIAPSGQGKSSAAIQASVCWGAGLSAFDIEPNFPLRITVIQAEDDESDLIQQCSVIKWLPLSDKHKNLIGQNVWIETLNDQIGANAVCVFDQILEAKPADLLVLNPYTAYLGADSKDEEANSVFLRKHLQSLLNKHNCAVLIIHHTPKTNFRSDTQRWTTTDWMYSGAGASLLSNWARAIIAIDQIGETGIFKFIAAKRWHHIGWDSSINYFKHDQRPNVTLWSNATALEIAQATGSASNHDISSEQLLAAVPPVDGISMMRLRKELEKVSSQRNAKTAIDLAIEDGIIHPVLTKGLGHAGRIKMIFRSNASSNH